MGSLFKKKTEPGLLEVIRLIGATPQVSQREVASTLGISLGKANHCIRELIGKGYVKAENYRNRENKLGYLYLLTPTGQAARDELVRCCLAEKIKEYDALRVEIAELRNETARAVGEE
jgi:EPS-associated MarR family transcriptional regulator